MKTILTMPSPGLALLTMTGEESSSPSTRIFRLSRMISFPFLSFPSVVQCSPRPVVATSVSSSLFFSATSGG